MATLAHVNQPVRLAHERLLEAAADGDLATLCDDHHLDLFVVFGSVLVPDADPADLDVAVRFGPGGKAPAVLHILDDLYRLTGSELVDLMVLNRAAPLARERALTTGEPLFQRRQGDFATAQIAAIMERLDTDRFRAMELELMSS